MQECAQCWNGVACDLVLYPPPIIGFLLYLSNFVHIPGAPNWQGWTYVTAACRKYVWPPCNYSEGFNYQESSQVLTQCHTVHFENFGPFDCICHFFSMYYKKILLKLVCGQCSCFQANTPRGTSLPPHIPSAPHPPSTPLSIFPNMQENTQRGHGRLEPRPKTAIPIWIQEDTSWGYEQIRHFQ